MLVGVAVAVAEEAKIDEAINSLLSQPQAYEFPEFKKFVIHCSSHVAETCSESEALHESGGGTYGLALCLSDSMRRCLVDHGASLSETTHQDSSEDPKFFRPPPVNGVPVPLPPPLSSAPDAVEDDHQTPQVKAIPDSIRHHPLFIETLKFQAVLRTCSNVSARTCFIHPHLSACLIPSMNQCVYPHETPDKLA
ncbi:unnamed protein product [Sphenostylis stenocarpa]|uniref:Uncharacterized protein n=1 Tax=Sphenostylis stenocarpa TaxID=92480 RepID=A0AA86SL11_9FABA|nr:unnamed protein product [Sphenostylis stenocarpa]